MIQDHQCFPPAFPKGAIIGSRPNEICEPVSLTTRRSETLYPKFGEKFQSLTYFAIYIISIPASDVFDSCIKCRDVFVSLLAQQQAKRTQTYMSSPVQVSPKRPSAGPSFSATATYGDRQFGESMKSNGLAPIGEERYSGRSPTIKPLSVTHPRPLSIDINRCSALSPKLARKPERELEDYGSPDALYFGKRNRRMLGQAYRRPSAAVEPSFPNLKTSSPMMKVRDNDFAA